MSETKKITVNIAGKNYPLLINPSEEEAIRQMETNLKARYLSITNEYPKLEAKDHLTMMLLELGMEQISSNNRKEEGDSIAEVDKLITKVDNSLE